MVLRRGEGKAFERATCRTIIASRLVKPCVIVRMSVGFDLVCARDAAVVTVRTVGIELEECSVHHPFPSTTQ